MEYRKELKLDEFEFWSGGREWYEEFEENGKLDLLKEQIETAFDGRTPTATEINDFVWFDERLHELLELACKKDEEDEDEEM